MRITVLLTLGGLLCGAAPSALAQSQTAPSFGLEIASDERRRGLSWSDGKAVLRGDASVPIGANTSIGAAVTSLRESKRLGGADAVIDITLNHGIQAGAWRLSASGNYHLFPGANGQGYGEAGADADLMLGPATASLFARYAPSQSAIGGDLLYLGAKLSAGIPQTPFTISAHVGHSSGGDRGNARSTRLLPGGSYWDHGVALDYYRGRWSAGLLYTDSSVTRTIDRHAGANLLARVALRF